MSPILLGLIRALGRPCYYRASSGLCWRAAHEIPARLKVRCEDEKPCPGRYKHPDPEGTTIRYFIMRAEEEARR